jgi:hypothetical protein
MNNTTDSKTEYLSRQLTELRAEGLYNHIRTIESPMDGRIVVDGHNVLNFCANNYLGLANHPRLKEAAKGAIDRYGIGPGAVRTIAGTMTLHAMSWRSGWPLSKTPRPSSHFRADSPLIWRLSPRWSVVAM